MDKAAFLAELTELAKLYIWSGDSAEVRAFVQWAAELYEQPIPSDESLAPKDYTQMLIDRAE